MSSLPSPLNIKEFCSQLGDATLFYQILPMEGSLYIWVGTEAGQIDSLVGAFGSRVTAIPPSTSTFLGSAGEGRDRSLAQRLQARTGRNVFLSAQIPDALWAHAEEELVARLTS